MYKTVGRHSLNHPPSSLFRYLERNYALLRKNAGLNVEVFFSPRFFCTHFTVPIWKAVILSNYSIFVQPGLRSPPYLTAEPDVFHYKLEGNDKFVVLASDGLWDMLSNEEVRG